MMPGGEGDAAAGGFGLALRVPVGHFDDAVCRAAATARAAAVCSDILVFRGQLLIADEAVGPEIGDADLEVVVACVHGIGHIETEREFPEDAEVFAVDENLGQDLDAAEVEKEAFAIGEGDGGDVEFTGVGGGAGEVLDAGVGGVGPGDEFVEGCFWRSAQPGRERQMPGAGEFGRLRDSRNLDLLRLAAGAARR